MTDSKLTRNGREIAEALADVLADVTGAKTLRGRTINVPDLIDVRAIREQLGMSQQRFADTFGLKASTFHAKSWATAK